MAIDANISTGGTTSSNETLGSMVLSIARRLWKRTPTATEKEDLIQRCNDAQNEICTLHQNYPTYFFCREDSQWP